ncbi:MAG: anthranilate synthase component I [Candidatus Dormibacteria bacterium]
MSRVSSFTDVTPRDGRANVVPVAMEIQPDVLTPVSAHARLAAGGGRSFLFESADDPEGEGRYSFLGVDPFEHLTIRDGTLAVSGGDGGEMIVDSGESPLRALGRHLERYRSHARAGLPRFTGGAAGYLGYECAGYLEQVPRAPGPAPAADAVVMLFRNVLVFDHARQRAVLIANILLDRETLRDGYDRAVDELHELARRLRQPAAEEALPPVDDDAGMAGPAIAGLGRERYCDAVRVLKEHIRRGDILQAVLSEELAVPVGAPPFLVYRALRAISPAPYHFYLAMGEQGADDVFLGASPEMLVRVGEGIVETRPIAGTRPRGVDDRDDARLARNLLASTKERAEHLMLVDLSRNDVGRVAAPGSVRVSELMLVERFSHVMHMTSSVRGALPPDITPLEALLSCFPAGTLSGAPKIRAMQLLAGLEPSPRGTYGGAVICQDFGGRLNSCIGIRAAHLRDGIARVRAGAGIVADSNPDREYDEVLQKTAAVRRALDVAGAWAGTGVAR